MSTYFTLSTNHYLIFSAILFIIGIMGVLVRRNILIIFLCKASWSLLKILSIPGRRIFLC